MEDHNQFFDDFMDKIPHDILYTSVADSIKESKYMHKKKGIAAEASKLEGPTKSGKSPKQSKKEGEKKKKLKVKAVPPKQETVPAADLTPAPAPEPEVEVEVEVEFGRIEFNGEAITKKRKAPKDLLRKAEEKERRLEQLSPEEREKALNQDRVSKALLRAKGEKIRDDPKLLRDSLKKKQKQKEKSAKNWKERIVSQKRETEEKSQEKAKNRKERTKKKVDAVLARGAKKKRTPA